MLDFISILGLILTLAGALIGAEGYWNEKESSYYGRASFYYFNLEYYSSMIIQKYKSSIAFFYIALGTTIQMIAYVFEKKFDTEMDISWRIVIVFFVVLIWFISKKMNEAFAWRAIKRRVVADYYSRIQSGKLNEVQTEECWRNLYFVISHGIKVDYSSIDKENLTGKIKKYLKSK